MKTFFRISNKLLLLSIGLTCLVHYFLLKFLDINSNSMGMTTISHVISNSIATLITTFILYIIINMLARIFKKNLDGASNNKVFLVSWLFMLIMPNIGEVIYHQEKNSVKTKSEEYYKICLNMASERFEGKYDTIIDWRNFCSCTMNSILPRRDISYEEKINQLRNFNSRLFNESVVYCLDNSINFKPSEQRVFGLNNTDSIKLIRHGDLLKLNVKIGGLENYYVLDSGAEISIMSKETYLEYSKQNPSVVVYKLSDINLQMANGNLVVAERYLFDKITIGGFLIPNVIFAVSKELAFPIIGQNVLGRFKSFEVLNRDNLILTI
jgi:hypothetical protein